jgi:hypothetical protein
LALKQKEIDEQRLKYENDEKLKDEQSKLHKKEMEI